MNELSDFRRASTHAPTAGSGQDGLVVGWAALGLAWTIFVIYGVIRWIESGQAVPVDIQGPDVYAAWRLTGMRVLEASSMAFVLWTANAWLLRPWRRERRLTIEGMLLIGGCVGFFIDPLINQFHYTFAWNQHAVNLGTWASVLPGWAPQGAYAEGLLWAFPQYAMMSAGAATSGYWILCRLRARWPEIGLTTALAVIFAVFLVGDLVVEMTFVLLQVYAFPRTHSALTLFAGELYQFPIYESIFVAAQAVPLTLMLKSARESADGLSFVERGAARLPAGYRAPARCFAVIGFTFVIFGMYFFPQSWLSVTPDSIIQLPSYLRDAPM